MTRPEYARGIVRAGALSDAVTEAFHKRTKPCRGHLLWTGHVEHNTVPTLTVQLHRYSALQIAWVLHYGTDPVGKVIRSCDKPLCVNGRHLSDQRMRQQENLLMAAMFGIDMSAACGQGHRRREHASVAASGKVECRPCHVTQRRARQLRAKAVAA